MSSLSFCHLGIARVRSGDVIRCTVMFEQQQDIDGIGQIPVVFSVNGTRLAAEGGQIFIKHNPDKPWYPYIGFDQQNSVLAKVNKSCYQCFSRGFMLCIVLHIHFGKQKTEKKL